MYIQSGSQNLIETLSEKNLGLSEKIEQLNETIQDLEALKEVAVDAFHHN